MITLTEKQNGLLITLDKGKKREFRQYLAEETKKHGDLFPADLLECSGYLGNGWDEIAPEKIGALTDSPIIGHNVYFDEDGEIDVTDDSKFYWFPDYQVLNPWNKLLKNGSVFFELA